MKNSKLKIMCTGSEFIDYKELKDLQGRLKSTDKNKIERLAKSLKKFGLVNPLQIWRDGKDNYCFDAHHRKKALKILEDDNFEIPLLPVTNCLAKNIKEAKTLLLAKESKYSFVELQGLEDYVKDIDLSLDFVSDNFDLIDLDFEQTEDEENDINDVEPKTDQADALQEKWNVKNGQIWQLGEHRLMCGDSTSKEDVQKLMDGRRANMVFTDPPYGVSYSARTSIRKKEIRENMGEIKNDNLRDDLLRAFIEKSLQNCILYSKKNAPFYICNNWHCAFDFLKVFDKLKIKIDAWIIWNKDWMSVGHGHYRSNHEFIFYSANSGNSYAQKGTEHDVWTLRKLSPDKKIHTTEKPTDLSHKAIVNSSQKNEKVLDLFGGSGSTLIACEQTNRKCYMMELDEKYCAVILERFFDVTGIEPALLN